MPASAPAPDIWQTQTPSFFAAKIESTGNERIMLCERGTSFGYNTLVSDMRALPILREIGCDYLQGYHYARPLSFDDFTRFVGRLPQQRAS